MMDGPGLAVVIVLSGTPHGRLRENILRTYQGLKGRDETIRLCMQFWHFIWTDGVYVRMKGAECLTEVVGTSDRVRAYA
jgi:hypothetical protein